MLMPPELRISGGTTATQRVTKGQSFAKQLWAGYYFWLLHGWGSSAFSRAGGSSNVFA
jgi:hypothetical protein